MEYDLTAAAYQAIPGGPLDVDKEFYSAIRDRAESQQEVKESFIIPIRSGKAWEVPAGSVCRITTVEGPQVADMNFFNLNDPREHMWAARTRQLQSAHVTEFDRLWSNLPFLRPMLTITGDSLKDYGKDSDGGRLHDLLGTRCDPYVNQMLSGEPFDYHCHSNLTRAIAPYRLTEFDVHDVLNVFQCTGLNENDEYFMKACPAQKGDYFEFFAEIDLLVALSTCPGGDLSIPMWGPDADKDPIEVCRPLGVEVFTIADELLEGWVPTTKAEYAGLHGTKQVPFAETV
ncbi:urea carboxylase-associated family protein [uncultured Corynebacterium sp.]|uniref:urea carboxylase-associated family protein n=1 Tax=uncultured Corynebacterium sp. TaxID=159447 RepID=UPI0025F44A82|nr:urea carboxylase-associated family protein [uncultured Corynebacterium sp.]